MARWRAVLLGLLGVAVAVLAQGEETCAQAEGCTSPAAARRVFFVLQSDELDQQMNATRVAAARKLVHDWLAADRSALYSLVLFTANASTMRLADVGPDALQAELAAVFPPTGGEPAAASPAPSVKVKTKQRTRKRKMPKEMTSFLRRRNGSTGCRP